MSDVERAALVLAVIAIAGLIGSLWAPSMWDARFDRPSSGELYPGAWLGRWAMSKVSRGGSRILVGGWWGAVAGGALTYWFVR